MLVWIEVQLPDLGQQLLPGARPARTSHQLPQEVELPLGQLRRPAAVVEVDPAAQQVEGHAARAQVPLRRGRRGVRS
jgi:hypothetical protein